ncbi:MAG: hypothetical protein ACE5JS_17120 [Nitrospinota bacterium]
MMTIYDYTARIRDLINAPRKQFLLIEDRDVWLKLCSSLDAIGDTDLALDSYLAERFPSKEGALYVIVYGVLQVLYVQQNAVGDLLRALGIKIAHEKYPRLSRIRDIRSASIGHPTTKKTKGGHSYHFITRVTLRKSGFMLLSDRPDGSTHWEEVRIPDLIAEQRHDVADILRRVITALETEEDRHREQFRGERLQDLLPPSLSYHFQKIAEATAGKTTEVGTALGQVSVKTMREALERLRDALTRRGLAEAYHLNEYIEVILYPLSEIDTFFEAIKTGAPPGLNERLAYICAFFVDNRIERLRQMAREIDEEYAKRVRSEGGGSTA